MAKSIRSGNTQMRAKAMQELYGHGWSLDDVGEAFALSRERVRQVLEEFGRPEIGGVEVRRFLRIGDQKKPKNDTWEKWSLKHYGMSRDEVIALNGGLRPSHTDGVALVFLKNRRSAIDRGIGWKITFKQWLDIWGDKLPLRGRGKGKYCLSRYGDTGAYTVDNVQVILNEVNCSESYEIVSAAQRLAKRVGRKLRGEDGLTDRQREMLRLYLGGAGPTEIGEKLGVKAGTVNVQLNSAKRITGLLHDAKTS